jgi:hypothetical protein
MECGGRFRSHRLYSKVFRCCPVIAGKPVEQFDRPTWPTARPPVGVQTAIRGRSWRQPGHAVQTLTRLGRPRRFLPILGPFATGHRGRLCDREATPCRSPRQRRARRPSSYGQTKSPDRGTGLKLLSHGGVRSDGDITSRSSISRNDSDRQCGPRLKSTVHFMRSSRSQREPRGT